jgi:hypothetical protein
VRAPWKPACLVAVFMLSACQGGTATAPGSTSSATPPAATASPAATAAATPEPTATPPPEHPIGVRVQDGAGEFYDRASGQKFVPRGMNYVRLAPQTKQDGSIVVGHSTFDPGAYDASRVRSDLGLMHADGYNVVRVFLSPETMGTLSGGLSSGYMDNVADFLAATQESQIYVIFTYDWPPGGKYGSILSGGCCEEFNSFNANILPAAGLEANQVFYQDFIAGLIDRGAPTGQVFSWQLRNELYFDSDQPPLSLKSGSVTTANGKSYDMASATDRTAMLNEGLVYWIDQMRASILEVDPTALVSVGFFQPQAPNRTRVGDLRIAVTEPAIWQSSADFIDLHPYPGFELSLKQYVANFGIKGMAEKPIIMGEFGAMVGRYASVSAAAKDLVAWQVASCSYGFDGWLFWTWDTSEQPDFFTARQSSATIDKALRPASRPDPCVK